MSKRSIFEDVSGDQPQERPQAQPGGIDRARRGARGAIRAWLSVLFALVVAMIVVGGLTRLTDSGLSITEWRPVTGAIPPLSEADWQAEFEKYKQIDQWRIQNQWMQLEDFKVIYWWEWGHRQLGRVIGLIWAVGFLGFAVARQIPVGWAGKLLLPGLLGGLQGGIGWWMVASGVTQGEGMTAVASYRLATHLGLAFVILGVISWYMFQLGREERDLMQARRAKESKLFSLSTGLLHFSFLQIILGALVAGIDAGRSYTDWPLMGGQIIPPDPFMIEPLWKNFFENPGLVQFIHRVSGYLLLAFGVVVWLRGRNSAHPRTQFAFNAVFAALLLQMVLGIVTVLYAAPWQIAILHQLMAVCLWVLILRARFLSAYPIATSIKDY
ncbi:heme A synthase [Phaeobacter italicus]|jgi:cytochrome c oxidase assembly protein subunit 15|uniref:Heme A synthase n=1 Tax=Phaeobacter italicus TaxID=481446 RepID=A0A0H5DAU9_9RHOB|nr:heme A synthase [Phaeobacter italicus]EEB71397.1 cytochrome oxidase assembly [Ruegeria sp. R11]MEC8016940.1 heme A synthase [Pseudomonadota bacterium]MBY6042706.1 COX15/CtaA family protein [Phaeobacter italicus]MCI5101678.1 COX15/CtaA family protein [Phaeobacter italicus]MEE2818504.1 heme A synthase [Pseudomonadota bacterium]